jgi:hypothetical protein
VGKIPRGAPPRRVHFPVREALPASGEESPNCVVRGCDLGADLKAPRHELHRLNTRHRTEDKNRGVATVRWQYDTDWNTVEEGYLGADLHSERNAGSVLLGAGARSPQIEEDLRNWGLAVTPRRQV